MVVLVAVRTKWGDAVFGALAVDGVLLIPTVVAGHARVLVTRLLGAELG